MGGAA
ncbi:hypothetical protein MTP34_04210 [Klebsiella pneumoniae]|jgi:Golgi phosphoprotein 3